MDHGKRKRTEFTRMCSFILTFPGGKQHQTLTSAISARSPFAQARKPPFDFTLYLPFPKQRHPWSHHSHRLSTSSPSHTEQSRSVMGGIATYNILGRQVGSHWVSYLLFPKAPRSLSPPHYHSSELSEFSYAPFVPVRLKGFKLTQT